MESNLATRKVGTQPRAFFQWYIINSSTKFQDMSLYVQPTNKDEARNKR